MRSGKQTKAQLSFRIMMLESTLHVVGVQVAEANLSGTDDLTATPLLGGILSALRLDSTGRASMAVFDSI